MKRVIPCLWIAVLATLTLLWTIDVAVAQRNQRGKRRSSTEGWTFVASKYDTNKDESVSIDEYTRGKAAFKSLDTNSDGVLNIDDWKNQTRRRHTGSAPSAGEAAPDFSLTDIRTPETTVTLSDFTGKKPVALLFGSCT